MKLFKALALTALGTVMFGAQSQAATVLFQDNFNTDTLGLNATPPGWTVTNGSVDLIGKQGAITSFDLLPGNGVYVDMDGSSNAQGAMHTTASFNFVPGQTYTLSYDLAGNNRVTNPAQPGYYDRVRASIAGAGPTILVTSVQTLAGTAGFTTFTDTFTVAAPITAAIFFRAVSLLGSDNRGLLLDNVKLTAVPLPGALWLLLSGIAGMGAFARRRRVMNVAA